MDVGTNRISLSSRNGGDNMVQKYNFPETKITNQEFELYKEELSHHT